VLSNFGFVSRGEAGKPGDEDWAELVLWVSKS
jgi:hypothetical protein